MSSGTEVAATCTLVNCSVCPRRRYKRAHMSTRSTKKQMLPSRYKLKLKFIPKRLRMSVLKEPGSKEDVADRGRRIGGHGRAATRGRRLPGRRIFYWRPY